MRQKSPKRPKKNPGCTSAAIKRHRHHEQSHPQVALFISQLASTPPQAG